MTTRVFDSSSSNLPFNLIVLFRQKCPLVSVIVAVGLANLSCSCDHCENIENKPDKGLLPQNQFCSGTTWPSSSNQGLSRSLPLDPKGRIGENPGNEVDVYVVSLSLFSLAITRQF